MSAVYRWLSRWTPQTVERGLHGLALATVLGTLLAVRNLIFMPLLNEQIQYSSQAHQAEQLIENLEEIEQQHQQSQKEFEEEGRRLAILKQKVPSTPDESDFLAQVTRLARQCGVDVNGYRPGNITTTSDYQELTINLVASGTYNSICRFLLELDQLPRLCHVVDLKVHATNAESTRYPFELSLRIFFIPEV